MKNLSLQIRSNFARPPKIFMMGFYMSRLVFNQFKIFYSVIGFYSVDVMNNLTFAKFPTKFLLHEIAVILHPFTVNVYAQIAKYSHGWLTFFKIIPVWRNIVSTMSAVTRIMHNTNLPNVFRQNVFTPLNFTEFTLHNYTLACGERFVK